MVQVVVIFLMLCTSAFAADDDWLSTSPASNRIFLTHKSKKVFALVTKFQTGFSDEKFDEYLVSDFQDEIVESRKNFLVSQNDFAKSVIAGTDTLNGFRYGGVAFNHFRERVWAQENTLWHVAMFINDGSDSHPLMNEIMLSIVEVKKTSFFGSLIPSAYAHNGDDCGIPSPEFRELNGIIKNINDSKCNVKGINPKKLSKHYGLKFTSANFGSCLKGSGDALRKMKNGFLSTIEEWKEQTGKEIKKMNCVEPKQPSGFLASMGYSQQMQAYQYCLSAASMSAGVGMMADSVSQTLTGIKSLYQWVKAEEHPIRVMASILASKYDGFMCLTPEAQQEAICEFSTHFIAALGATAAGVGSVMAIKKGLGAVRAVASLAPVATKSPGIARALLDAKNKVNGVSPAFISAAPFVMSVAKGQAEAAKVITALQKGAILEKSPEEMDKMLKAKGFTRIDTCIKMNGKCVEHINVKTGKQEIAPMVVYVHPSGVAARIKPHGDSTSKFRPKPHGSFMLVDPEDKKLGQAIKDYKAKKSDAETLMNTYLSWDRELAKVDMKTGNPLPSAPSRTQVPAHLTDAEKTLYNDTISGLTHFNMD